jgi:hypothetical protein
VNGLSEFCCVPISTPNLQVPRPFMPNLMAPTKAQPTLTHKFSVGGHEGYITVGLYPNGQPGEVLIRMAKEGSTISGPMDSFAMIFSIALQHGVPLQSVCENSLTPDSSLPAGRGTRRWAMPRASWTIWDVGCSTGFSRGSNSTSSRCRRLLLHP